MEATDSPTVNILKHSKTHLSGWYGSEEVSLSVLILTVVPLPHLQSVKVTQQAAVEQAETLLCTGVQIQLLEIWPCHVTCRVT